VVARNSPPGKKLQGGEKTGGGRASNRNLDNEPPFWVADVSADRSPKRAPRDHSLLGSSPLIPALLLLLIVAFLPSSKWFRQSVRSAVTFPVVQHIFALIKGRNEQPLMPKVKVWINRQSGFYYCWGDVLFGKDRGMLMTQDEALTSGYRPAIGHYCTTDKATEVSRNSEPSPKDPGAK
jgi:hypothetical protein